MLEETTINQGETVDVLYEVRGIVPEGYENDIWFRVIYDRDNAIYGFIFSDLLSSFDDDTYRRYQENIDAYWAREKGNDEASRVFDYQDKRNGLITNFLRHYDVYTAVEAEKDVPWEMIAAIHYEETEWETTLPDDDDGPFQILFLSAEEASCPDFEHDGRSDFRKAARCVADILLHKCSPGYCNNTSYKEHCFCTESELTRNTTDEAVIKDAFAGYNSRSYYPNESTYVMNWFNSREDPQMCTNYRGRSDPRRKYGAYRVFLELKKLMRISIDDPAPMVLTTTNCRN